MKWVPEFSLICNSSFGQHGGSFTEKLSNKCCVCSRCNKGLSSRRYPTSISSGYGGGDGRAAATTLQCTANNTAPPSSSSSVLCNATTINPIQQKKGEKRREKNHHHLQFKLSSLSLSYSGSSGEKRELETHLICILCALTAENNETTTTTTVYADWGFCEFLLSLLLLACAHIMESLTALMMIFMLRFHSLRVWVWWQPRELPYDSNEIANLISNDDDFIVSTLRCSLPPRSSPSSSSSIHIIIVLLLTYTRLSSTGARASDSSKQRWTRDGGEEKSETRDLIWKLEK